MIQRTLAGGARRRRHGFLLVEVVAALGVLLLVGLAGVSTQVTCMSLVRTSNETKVAVSELEAAMEQILSVPLDDIPDLYGPYAARAALPAFPARHPADETITVTYPGFAGGAVPDPLEIRLTLAWNDYAGRPRTLALSGMRTR